MKKPRGNYLFSFLTQGGDESIIIVCDNEFLPLWVDVKNQSEGEGEHTLIYGHVIVQNDRFTLLFWINNLRVLGKSKGNGGYLNSDSCFLDLTCGHTWCLSEGTHY